MADDKVAIWGSGLKFGRKPANGELLIGNGQDLTLATLTAGAGASITSAAGSITIAATGTGVGTVTASAPLASSGGTSPNISLTGVVGVANGGTGQSSLTANNVILGNGTSAVQFVAPGASGNVLTSDGSAWQSSPPLGVRTYKLTDQSITSSIAWTDATSLSFPVSANVLYAIDGCVFLTCGAGGIQLGINGPTLTSLLIAITTLVPATAYDTTFYTSATAVSRVILFQGKLQCSAAGTAIIRFRQNTSNAAATTIEKGSWITYDEVA